MKIDDKGIEFLIDQEGYSKLKYKDIVGLDTIGVGHLVLPGEKFDEPLTDARIKQLLVSDLVKVECTINNMGINFTQNQHNALCSLIFNIGVGAFNKSTVKKVILANKSFNEIRGAWLLWKKAGGIVSKGLLSRRFREIALYGS